MRHSSPLFALCLLSLTAGSAVAADTPWWQFWGGVADNAADAAVDSVAHDVVQWQFTPHQQVLLRDFLVQQQGDSRYQEQDEGRGHGKKQKDLPPGLRKKLARGGELPPGWQKKLARGEVVDAQVWQQSRHLPPDLIGRLGMLPPDTEIRYIEDKIYRVVRNTREIVDILGL